jgi:hypothetical protein
MPQKLSGGGEGERLIPLYLLFDIFDLFDTLIGGFSRFTEALSTRLNLATSAIIPGLGSELIVARAEGKRSEARYWQCVPERTQ